MISLTERARLVALYRDLASLSTLRILAYLLVSGDEQTELSAMEGLREYGEMVSKVNGDELEVITREYLGLLKKIIDFYEENNEP